MSARRSRSPPARSSRSTPTARSATIPTAPSRSCLRSDRARPNITKNDTFTYAVPGGDAATRRPSPSPASNNDILRRTAGGQSLTGGLANDAYFVENSGDTVNEIAGQGTDRVLASTSYLLAAG